MTDESDSAPPDREHLLGLLEDGIDEAHHKAVNGRVYDNDNEETRQGWLRTLGYLAGQYRQLKKDEQLDDLEERVEEIAKEQNSSDFRLK